MHAQEYGAVGAILYNDPIDYAPFGINLNQTYNATWYMPPSGAQRGSTFISNGDPLTPIYPSTGENHWWPWWKEMSALFFDRLHVQNPGRSRVISTKNTGATDRISRSSCVFAVRRETIVRIDLFRNIGKWMVRKWQMNGVGRFRTLCIDMEVNFAMHRKLDGKAELKKSPLDLTFPQISWSQIVQSTRKKRYVQCDRHHERRYRTR